MTNGAAVDTAPHQNAVFRVIAGGDCLTIDHIVSEVDLTRRQTIAAVTALVIRGLADRKERGCYCLTSAGQEMVAAGEVIVSGPRVQGQRTKKGDGKKATQRQRVWDAMRIKRKFSLADIMMISKNEKDRAIEGNTYAYISALLKAGYLHRCRDIRGFGRPAKRYLLIYDSGSLAPIASRRGGAIYDPNTGKTALRHQQDGGPDHETGN